MILVHLVFRRKTVFKYNLKNCDRLIISKIKNNSLRQNNELSLVKITFHFNDNVLFNY